MLQTELTSFRALVKTEQGIDLTQSPFAEFSEELRSRTNYESSQALGSAMREAAVEAFRYWSARDAESGVCVGVLSPAAFGRRLPKQLETWHCVATREGVEFVRRDYFARESMQFERAQYLTDGALPSPAV